MLGIATGWILLAALVTVTGATATRWLILPRVDVGAAGEVHLDDSVATLGWYGAIGLLVGMVLFFGRQLAEFRDPFAPLLEDASLLLRTDWGTVWALGAAASLALLVLLQIARGGARWPWWVATLLVLGLVTFPAFTGHAAGEEQLRSLALAADALHVLAASAWMGGLGCVLYLDYQARRPAECPRSLLPVLVPAFSPVAIGSVSVLVATGAFASWLHVDGVAQLVATSYGRTLLLKLLVVTVVLGLGALNWRRLSPRLGDPGGDDALRRAAAVELMMGHAVLFITAALIRTSPMSM